MSGLDSTSRKVRETLLDAARAAYAPALGIENPFDYCACGHHRGAHHDEGRGRCDDCPCGAFTDADLECPDCLAVWPNGHARCPRCGLTIETVAERLAR